MQAEIGESTGVIGWHLDQLFWSKSDSMPNTNFYTSLNRKLK